MNYVARFSRVSEYVLYGLPADSSTRRVIARMPVKGPAYMHAFGMSERYLILAEYPLRVNPLKLAFSGKPFIENYTWRGDEADALPGLRPLEGQLRGTYETDAFFCFHHVNAFERGGELVIDLCAYEDSSVIDSLYLDDAGPKRHPAAGGAAALHARPGRRRRALGAAHRRLARAAADRLRAPQHARLLVRVLHRGRTRLDRPAGEGGRARRLALEWRADGCYPGEPVFVREPGGEGEDDGVVLSVVLDANAGRSFLLVLDAGSFEEIARAEAPHHIPFGFHGHVLPMSDLLASDADRERTAERLRAGAGEGEAHAGRAGGAPRERVLRAHRRRTRTAGLGPARAATP